MSVVQTKNLEQLSITQKKLNYAADLAEQELARRNANDFIPYVLKDQTGQKVVQSQIHKEMQFHVDECRRRGVQYCGILAPWGHGKSENIVIGRTLKLLGEDRNKRIFVVCNTDDNAKARVTVIGRYILTDADYHSVYPEVKEAEMGEWTRHKIIVERDSMSKDGSVESWGIMSSGIGGRCDILIFDDPVDMRNALLNPSLRSSVKDSFKNIWLSRLMPDGFAVYIATAWHKDDLTHELLRNPAWKFLVMRISDDYESIDCSSSFKGEYKIPLWSIWNKEKLLDRLSTIGQRAFNRGFRQEALSDEDKTFPHSEQIFHAHLSKDFIMPSWPKVVGVDPFGQQVVIFVLALVEGRLQRVPVEVRRGKWDPARTINEILEVNRIHRPFVFVVENNAAQDAIVQWAREKGGANLNIVPFTTGMQKANPDFGLPSLDVEFENGSWIVPMAGHELGCRCGLCVWRQELSDHPVGEVADTVMASWFAREGARMLTHNVPQEEEQIITEQDVGLERVEIGSYD